MMIAGDLLAGGDDIPPRSYEGGSAIRTKLGHLRRIIDQFEERDSAEPTAPRMEEIDRWKRPNGIKERGRSMTVEVAGETAFVTGSSRGIGRGIALRLAECGVREVAVHYHRNEGAAEETLGMLREHGAEGFVVQGDLSELEDVQRVFETVGDRLGSLDVFVSNARSDLDRFYEPVMDIPLEKWQDAIDNQARAFLIGARESAHLMSEGGRIVAITYTPGGETGTWRPWVAMGAAKAAIETLCRYFAVALAERGITVNAVSPGATDDSVFNSLPPKAFEMIEDRCESGWVPMKRMTTPADVGDVVSLLCAEEAGFLTGQVIYADGGAHLALADLPLALQQG